MQSQDWESFYANMEGNSSKMVECLHALLEGWMDLCFPFKTSRRRTDEDPWITNGIRRKMRMRMRIFLREGRSLKWKRINKEIRKMIKAKKIEYINEVVARGKRNDAAYFRLVK